MPSPKVGRPREPARRPKSPRHLTSPPTARIDSVKPKFIDLFAGIGGMRLAFEKAGAECVFTSEYDKYAAETYSANFDGRIHGDITKIPIDEIPDHDILVAGFPCQPFSIAGVSKKNSLGRKHGFLDLTQGTLFFNVASIINEKRPATFLLENVKHLVRHNRGETFRTICNVLTKELGYYVHVGILDGSRLVPQKRERVFIVGFREPRAFKFPSLPAKGPRLERVLQAEVDPKYTLSNHLWNYLKQYAEKHRALGNGFGFGLFGPEDVARTLSARYFKDGSEILIRQRGKNPRRLTPRECASLMGFPKSFRWPVSDTRAYKQFGNSVVVPLVRLVACEIVKSLWLPQLEMTPELPMLEFGAQRELIPA